MKHNNRILYESSDRNNMLLKEITLGKHIQNLDSIKNRKNQFINSMDLKSIDNKDDNLHGSNSKGKKKFKPCNNYHNIIFVDIEYEIGKNNKILFERLKEISNRKNNVMTL